MTNLLESLLSCSFIRDSPAIIESDALDALWSAFIYTGTPKLRDERKKGHITKCQYSCIDQKCDFRECRTQLAAEMPNGVTAKVCAAVFDTIERSPQDYYPHHADGYVICQTGMELVRASRKDNLGMLHTGYLDLTEFRSKLQYAAIAKKESIAE